MPGMSALDPTRLPHIFPYEHFGLSSALAAASSNSHLSGLPASFGLPHTGHPPSLASMLFYPSPHYSFAMPALLTESLYKANKSSSIADLRLKAKQHAAALGYQS
ncbi:PREDICTED: short stature homeobox protein 2-like [Priapulus caudatus]|uniref:Short stature homeobox protein 2-like n=1 Tax=Priapulus caudatus TaxID=37621 RepID=A0ABM1DUW1_PRICU|nr:PREDICTED: short stature homeobox protein 2-like [Priapulus caudatus]